MVATDDVHLRRSSDTSPGLHLHKQPSAFHVVEHGAEHEASIPSDGSQRSAGSFGGHVRCNSCLNCHGMSNAVPGCNCCPRGCGEKFRKRRVGADVAAAAAAFLLPPEDASAAPAIVVNIDAAPAPVPADHAHPKVVVVSQDVPTVPAPAANGNASPVKLPPVSAKIPPPAAPSAAPVAPARKKSGCCVIA